MRPPSSFEQPADAKMSATKTSSAFALMVTVAIHSSSSSSGPRASGSLMSESRGVTSALRSSRSGRLSPAAALQVGDVAAVPGRVDHDLVDHDVRRQAGDVADQVADILRLSHARALLLGDRHRPLVEDRRRDLAGANDAGADAVDAFLH